MPSPRIPTSGIVRDGDSPRDGLPEHYRRVVSFTQRGARMNPVQTRAFDAHADAWYLEATDLGDRLDPTALFGRSAPLVIEIGSGMGDATAGMAAARPDVNLLAVEVYRPGIAQTFHHLAKAGVGSVRVLRADIVPVLTDLVPPDSVEETWLFFPDPWPKNRHHKRRLLTTDFATLVASRLRPGGTFRLATDWPPYAQVMRAALDQVPALRNRYPDGPAGQAPRPDFRPTTRFERRGLLDGRPIADFCYERR